MKKETNKEVQSTKEEKSTKGTKAKMYINIGADASSKESKQFRSKRRSILFSYVNKIISTSLQKDSAKELKNEIKSFLKMYKAQYVCNDFAIESLYVGSNDLKKEDLKRMIALVQKDLGTKNK